MNRLDDLAREIHARGRVAAFSGLSMDEAVAAKLAKNLARPRLNGRSW